MAKIRKDQFGIYAKVGGWIARPVCPTKFSEGDTVDGKHFGGSRSVGMGKLPGRGEYEEYWRTWDAANLKYEPWKEYF